MINDLLKTADFPTGKKFSLNKKKLKEKDNKHIGQLISAVENYPTESNELRKAIKNAQTLAIPVIGITGTGGSGKSSLVDELVRRYLSDFQDKSIAIISVDPDLIILETSGIGQSDTEITEFSDTSLYVMTPEYGAATQLEKIDMLDFADFIAINKYDKRGAEDALRDVKKQYARNHGIFDSKVALPIFGTIASQFHDQGVKHIGRPRQGYP